MLDEVVGLRGKPRLISLNNVLNLPRTTSMPGHMHGRSVRIFSGPGSRSRTTTIESFDGKLRNERLSQTWFESPPEAKKVIAIWKKDYENTRPHSSFGDQSHRRHPEERYQPNDAIPCGAAWNQGVTWVNPSQCDEVLTD